MLGSKFAPTHVTLAVSRHKRNLPADHSDGALQRDCPGILLHSLQSSGSAGQYLSTDPGVSVQRLWCIHSTIRHQSHMLQYRTLTTGASALAAVGPITFFDVVIGLTVFII